ncbi:Inositol 1,4,5-trisphosphate receptor-interacting protein-like 1, partial [Tyto alba]
VVEEVVANILRVYQEHFSNSFFPVLQPAIGVGSAFEGWSAPEDADGIYRVLVPLQPPRGHAFHPELDIAGQNLERNFCICVELDCTCPMEQLVGQNMLCFLHHPEEQLRRNQDPSLLSTLCTGSYLDVQKTAHWFQNFVRSAWVQVPQSHQYNMSVLPSSCSCRMKLTDATRRTILAEVMFGVQQGDSDIFLSSHITEATFISSTTWTESCTVAEVKFFRHIAGRVPHGSFHLRCLQLCTRILMGTGFSTYTMKTVLIPLLASTHPSDWHKIHFLRRLEDIMGYMHFCLQERRLNHFFFGSENVPEEIILPTFFHISDPINLFQGL